MPDYEPQVAAIGMDAGRVDLWCCRDVPGRGWPLIRENDRILSDSERRTRQRFRFEHDRARYATTRVLVRSVLARYAPVAPQDWEFENNAYGRPSIRNDVPEARRISFNISHSRDFIVLAVACDRTVGIDTESLGNREVSDDIAERYFAPNEFLALRTLPAESRHQRFFEYWTLKESYIKARGMGLSIPLNSFSFEFDGARIRQSIDSGQRDPPSRWNFCQLLVEPHHLIALCIEAGVDEGPRLCVREIVPYRLEREPPFAVLRSSVDRFAWTPDK